METLFRNYRRLLDDTQTTLFRYLFDKIAWNNRLISISGARGTGKTTMMLQRIKTAFPNPEKALYVSLDNIWFTKNSLIDLADYFYAHGGTHLFIDEVHRYPNWAIEIKNIYDSYPSLFMVFTGSSMLKIYNSNADLSRRVVDYKLYGLSLREYLAFEDIGNFSAISLEDLLKNHIEIAENLIRDVKILPLFEKYLQTGYYPFYKEDSGTYFVRLNNVVNTIFDSDLPAIDTIEYATAMKVKKLLKVLSALVPFEPNISNLSQSIETNRANILKYFDYLQRAGLLNMYSRLNQKIKTINKPDKIYLNNTNLLYALNTEVNVGNVRETFFANQLTALHQVNTSEQGDFLIDEKYLIEVGGKSKNYAQIKNIVNSYITADDIELGFGNKIPLWLFGFLY